MSPFGFKILARSVRILKITTETTSTNVNPFLKYVHNTFYIDAVADTTQEEWEMMYMANFIHNTLKYDHKIR